MADARSEAVAAAVLLLAQAAHPDAPVNARCVEIERTTPPRSVLDALSDVGEVCRDIGPLRPGPWMLSATYQPTPAYRPHQAWNCASQRLDVDPPGAGGLRNEIRYSAGGGAESARNVTLYLKVANPSAKGELRRLAVRAGTEAARRVHVSLTAEEIAFLSNLPVQGRPKPRTVRGVHIEMTNFVGGDYVVQFAAPYVEGAC